VIKRADRYPNTGITIHILPIRIILILILLTPHSQYLPNNSNPRGLKHGTRLRQNARLGIG